MINSENETTRERKKEVMKILLNDFKILAKQVFEEKLNIEATFYKDGPIEAKFQFRRK